MSRRELFGLLRGRVPVRAAVPAHEVARPVITPVWQVAEDDDGDGDRRGGGDRDGDGDRGGDRGGGGDRGRGPRTDAWSLTDFYAARARSR